MKLKFLFLFLIPIVSFSQLSAKVDSLLTALNNTDQVKEGFVGMGSNAMVDSHYESLYDKIDSLATDDELFLMADKGNEVIKHYMTGMLVKRKSELLAKLFQQYIYNDEEYHIQAGCTGYESSQAGTLYTSVFGQKENIEHVKYFKERYTAEEAKEYGLEYETKWTKPEIDSLVLVLNKIALSNDNVLPITLDRIFAVNSFNFDNYKRVRYFAYKHSSVQTLATLAGFQNKKDLPFFHQNIDIAYYAISKFPDKSFIPELKARSEKMSSDFQYLIAVAGFKTKDAQELLEMVMAKFEATRDEKREFDFFDGERLDHFYQCLEKNGSAFTDDFLLKMWTEHRIISYSFFIKIKDSHYDDILKGYQANFPFSSGPISNDFDMEKYKKEYEEADGYLCPIILKYLKSNPASNSIDLDAIVCRGF